MAGKVNPKLNPSPYRSTKGEAGKTANKITVPEVRLN